MTVQCSRFKHGCLSISQLLCFVQVENLFHSAVTPFFSFVFFSFLFFFFRFLFGLLIATFGYIPVIEVATVA